MTFDEKIKEILNKHKDIPANNWKVICFALFLEYPGEIINNDFREKERSF